MSPVSCRLCTFQFLKTLSEKARKSKLYNLLEGLLVQGIQRDPEVLEAPKKNKEWRN